LSIVSEPGHGTTVGFVLPIRRPDGVRTERARAA